MIIHHAKFTGSYPALNKCPKTELPEFAFIGRSNVGKSSLINMLVNQKGLAKTSSTPGKTQLLNFFLVNDQWYVVDLPGLGYAKTSKKIRAKFEEMVTTFIKKRENLVCTFLLVDSRHEPQKIDIEFMEWLATEGLPFVIVFTKADKLSRIKLESNIQKYKNKLLESWEELPVHFITSSELQQGREEILSFIQQNRTLLADHFAK